MNKTVGLFNKNDCEENAMRKKIYYKYILIYPSGEREESEDKYATEQDAEVAAQIDCSNYAAGADVMELMGDRDEDIEWESCDYEIIEVEE